MTRLRVGILGCGKVTESLHLPVAAANDSVEVVRLVDAHAPRARQLADAWNVPGIAEDYREVLDDVDAAIVALPNHLHAPVTIELLDRGIHVLVEKPMALSTGDCEAMVEAARRGGATLAVGLVRRHYASSRFVKEILDAGVLGRITHVDMREGGVFGWKVASDFMFRRESGGGVLADIGIHTLDLLLWWLGDATDVAYRDDARGGVEADCELRLELASGASAVVELSRLRRMRNSYVVTGERGTLEIGIGVDPEIRIGTGSDVFSLQGNALRAGRRDGSLHAVFERQLADFVQAIESNAPPFVPGTEGARAVRLIEACRRVRELLVHPWSVGAAARSATS